MEVRPLREEERDWLAGRLRESWGAPDVVSRGRLRDASQLDALVCEENGERLGACTLELRDGDCELVTIDAFAAGRGAGTALLEAAVERARAEGCGRLWLITTNDNTGALRFYQRRGLRLVALHPGAVDDARRLKPQISETGHDGIPIRDELELELRLR
jgi:ribosomal protein S18 acetylase RimI-like enzyme